VLKVSQPRVLAILVGSLLAVCLLGTSAMSQQASTPPAGGTRFPGEIALVDIQYIFKNFTRVKQYQTELQGDQDRAEAALKNDLDSIKKLSDRLSEFQAGSRQYDELDKEIVGRQADFNAHRTVMRKEFLKRAAKIHCLIYQQIQEEIDAFAGQYGVVAVLSFNRDVMDPEKPETVQMGLQNPVLWHHKNLDISQYILQNLERRVGSAQTGGINPRFPANGPGVQR
jgi:Skp family chaperone for outer membrane proteins